MNDTQINQVIDKLIQARLVRFIPNGTQNDGQIELVHEALIYNWPRYQGWLDTQELTRYKRLRLAKDAQDWDEQGRPAGLLWQGQILEDAKSYGNLNELEADFVKLSEATVEEAELQKSQLLAQVSSLSEDLQTQKTQEEGLQQQLGSLETKLRASANALEDAKLQEEELVKQIDSLSKSLKTAQVRENNLRNRLTSLSKESSSYQAKYRNALFLGIFLLFSTILATGIAINQSLKNNRFESLQSLTELHIRERV